MTMKLHSLDELTTDISALLAYRSVMSLNASWQKNSILSYRRNYQTGKGVTLPKSNLVRRWEYGSRRLVD